MSIVTKTGDHGTTALMYNRRVSKCHPRVEAYGCLDELNSALGAARCLAQEPFPVQDLRGLQQDLIIVMGELATAVDDLPRYVTDGFQRVGPEMTSRVEELIRINESAIPRLSGWAIPGDNPLSAALDIARATCRRAERRVCALHEAGELCNAELIVYLNRVGDLLWILARSAAK